MGFDPFHLHCAVASEHKEPYPWKVGRLGFLSPAVIQSSILLRRCYVKDHTIYEAEKVFLWCSCGLMSPLALFNQKRT